MLTIPLGTQESSDNIAYEGGLDLITPEMKKRPGLAIEALNIDIPAQGGYRSHPGYERFDGRPRPSDAGVTQLQATTSFDASLAVGDAVNGQTSGATGVCIYIDPTARKWIAVTRVTGAFQDGENIREGTTVLAVSEAFSQPISGDLGNQLAALAAANYRADIAAIPGSGIVRGVAVFGNEVYAWRDNAGGTAGVMHRATASGWAAVTLAEELTFTAGNSSVNDGDTLTQGGVTATIARVILISGTSPNIVGKLVITGRTGGNFAAGAATSTGGGALTLDGAQSAQSFAAGGKYGFREHNFAGNTAAKRLYGWNGVGRAFEFDGTYVAFIATGMNPDTPAFGEISGNRLWLAFKSSVQCSGPGVPHAHTVILGAAELAAGDDITGMLPTPGSEQASALIVFTKDTTKVIYGKTSTDFVMDTALPDMGARAYTAVNLAFSIFLDDLGITSLQTAQEFGNFSGTELSARIKPALDPKINFARCATVVRKDGQYKLFFSDGSGITAIFVGRKLAGMLPFQLAHVMNVACEGERNGEQIVLAGGDDGFVYELGRGRSFDGTAIEYRMRLAANFMGNPRLRKRMRRLRVDIQAPGYHTVSFGFVAGRNDPDIDAGAAGQTEAVSGGAGGFDDPTVGFDSIGFDGDVYTSLGFAFDVTATDISPIFTNSSDNQLPITFTGQSLAYTPRRVDRRK